MPIQGFSWGILNDNKYLNAVRNGLEFSMANIENNEFSLPLFIHCDFLRQGMDWKLTSEGIQLKALWACHAKKQTNDVKCNNPILSKLLNSTHSITTQQIPHHCEEEKTINQGFNLPIMSCQPITLALAGPPPT